MIKVMTDGMKSVPGAPVELSIGDLKTYQLSVVSSLHGCAERGRS